MVTGILQTDNLSRMFEIIVSKAFVTAYSDGTPEFEFRMCYRGGEQMDADHLKEDILSCSTGSSGARYFLQLRLF